MWLYEGGDFSGTKIPCMEHFEIVDQNEKLVVNFLSPLRSELSKRLIKLF
jgi:hypothetical protein